MNFSWIKYGIYPPIHSKPDFDFLTGQGMGHLSLSPPDHPDRTQRRHLCRGHVGGWVAGHHRVSR